MIIRLVANFFLLGSHVEHKKIIEIVHGKADWIRHGIHA